MISRALSARRLLVLLLMAVVTLLPATAGATSRAGFPGTIPLPDGWQPEGIAAGRGTSLYVGSIPTGAVWKADARTGQGDVLVPGQPGVRSAIGIKVDRRNRLFVAGGATGKAFVYDAATGADLASYQLAAPGAATFVNDVVVTGRTAWFTDSSAAQLYALPLGRHGRLPSQGQVRTLPLTGDFELGTTGRCCRSRPAPASCSGSTPAPARRPRSTWAGTTCWPTATACCWPAGCCSWSRTG
jgi:hypothetical protein